MQFNANGIGNKQAELGDFLEQHNVGTWNDTGMKALLKFEDSMHTELHHSTKGLSGRPRGWVTHFDSQVDIHLSEA